MKKRHEYEIWYLYDRSPEIWLWSCCEHDSSNVLPIWNEIYAAPYRIWTITSFALAVLDMIPIFTHFNYLFYFTFWYFLISIKCVWLCRFGRPVCSQYLKSNMTFIVRRKTLNILVSISAQIEWSTEWERDGVSEKYRGNTSTTVQRYQYHYWNIYTNIETLIPIF